jgi:hypothetical protein
MPSDDLVLNVRQIAGYPPASSSQSNDAVLIQRGGLGGSYLSIDPVSFVGTALASGGNLIVGGNIAGNTLTANTANLDGLDVNTIHIDDAVIYAGLDVKSINVENLKAGTLAVGGVSLATFVTQFNGRSGDVMLNIDDILCAGGAPLWSPIFQGVPQAPSPSPTSASCRIATTAFVQAAITRQLDDFLETQPLVFTFNGRSGDVMLTQADITGVVDIFASPAFTGIPTAPTAAPGTDTTQLATTAFVLAAIGTAENFAPIDSPQFTGFPSGPTAPAGSSTGQLATTAFVQHAITAGTAGVASFNTRTGAVTLTGADITGAGGALIVSPVFTGTPQAPTAAPGTATAQLATTAFVNAAIGGIGVETFNGRAGAVTLTTGDITGAGGAPIASAALTGTPSAPTAAPGVSTTQIATTAFVMAALSTGGVTSFNTRTGAITLLASDISAAGGATLVSPVFTGVPVAPTATAGTTTAQLATCAFVAAAISGSVASFNGRTGAVTLSAADISAAGGAPLASPHFNGSPTAPTATVGDNSTAIATTAYVLAAIGAATGVTTFNGRTGAVTLSAADISAAGGAPLASPTFTGIPAGPTAAAATNTTQLATTAFVMNQISLGGGVLSFNGRAGAVTLTLADVTTAFPASTTNPLMSGTASPGSSAAWARGDHIHPSDTTQLNLSGGTLTGTLNGTATVFSGQMQAGSVVSASGVVISRAVGAGQPSFFLQNNAAANVGLMYYNPANSNMGLLQLATGATAFFDASGNFTTSGPLIAGTGFGTRAGTAGGANPGSLFNFFWTSTALQAWIGNVNVGNVSLTSDYRIKQNVAALGDMWERVKTLRPISYEHCNYAPEWPGREHQVMPLIVADGVERWGFLAHELQEALVESAATGHRDEVNLIQSPNPWTVIAALVKALQEAMTRIEALEAQR